MIRHMSDILEQLEAKKNAMQCIRIGSEGRTIVDALKQLVEEINQLEAERKCPEIEDYKTFFVSDHYEVVAKLNLYPGCESENSANLMVIYGVGKSMLEAINNLETELEIVKSTALETDMIGDDYQTGVSGDHCEAVTILKLYGDCSDEEFEDE